MGGSTSSTLVTGIAMPALVVPGADFPAWAPYAALAVGLVTLVVFVVQAVRVFRRRDE